jgi:hypothetical protein
VNTLQKLNKSIRWWRVVAKMMLLSSLTLAAAAEVTGLRCEYRGNPRGIDVAKPRLGWLIEAKDAGDKPGPERGVTQQAYQILVASSRDLLSGDQGDLWDSGKVTSDRQNQIEYAGKALESRLQCWWKVRVWVSKTQTGDGATPDKEQACQWSKPAEWTMGLLRPEDWQAKWIGAVAKPSVPDERVGFHAAEATREDQEKWVQVDLGKSVPVERIILHPLNHDNKVAFGFPIRFRIDVSDESDFIKAIPVANHTDADYPNPGLVPVSFSAGNVTARYVRVTVTKLWNRQHGPMPYCFALGQLEVISDKNNLALKVAVTARDSVETLAWGKANLTDGLRIAAPNPAVPEEPKPSATIQLRKAFALDKKIKRAEAFICGLGFYELRLNGQKVGDRVLDPGWTNYRKTCLYSTYDVTAMLTQGSNAMGVMLGNGMYHIPGGRYTKFTGSFGPPKMIMQLHVEFADGTSQVVCSDDSWTWALSPVVFSCIYGGEDYDARKELPGWDKPGFSADAFKPVLVVDGPGGALASQSAPPIKVMAEYKPIKITEPKPGVWVYDFGQNCASMPRLTVQGTAGAKLRMTPGELLGADGIVSQGSSGGPAYYTYTLKGGPAESWSPRFFYYGSRYLQLDSSDHPPAEAPKILGLTSQFVHSSAATVGTFTCGNPLVNRVHDLITAAIKSNLQSVLTDCPHREKLGWMECTHLLAGCLMYNYDVPSFYAKIANDMAEAQLDNGLVPDIAPEFTVFGDGFRDSPEWGSAYIIDPWLVYQMYGDLTILARHYQGMKRYAGYLKSKSKDGIISHGLSDWYEITPGSPDPSKLTPKGLTATAIYYQDLVILKQTATLLNKPDEASQFDKDAQEVKQAFNRTFFHAEQNQYDRNTQTANAMPLVLGLVPEDRRAAVLAGLVAQIRAGGNKVTAGDIGFNYLMRALSDGGQGSVLYDMLIRDDGPGYAYQLKMGATSLTEAWDTNPGSSQNHCMLGHIEEWFYRGLGGIACDPAGPGFKKIIIKPQMPGDLGGASACYESPYGRIASNWKREGTSLTLDITIPPNTSATIHVPAREAAAVTEGGKAMDHATGVKFLQMDNGAAVVSVGSGVYRFCSQK